MIFKKNSSDFLPDDKDKLARLGAWLGVDFVSLDMELMKLEVENVILKMSVVVLNALMVLLIIFIFDKYIAFLGISCLFIMQGVLSFLDNWRSFPRRMERLTILKDEEELDRAMTGHLELLRQALKDSRSNEKSI